VKKKRWGAFAIGACVVIAALSGCATSAERQASGVVPSPIETCVGLTCLSTVLIGDVKNPADKETGLGSVDEEFSIGAFEITVEQYLAFLNAVATVPSSSAVRDLWVSDMQKTYKYVSPGLISRTGTGTSADPYRYAQIPDPALGAKSSQRSILNISWFSAARFVNWLHNGATAGASSETGAYTLNGAVSGVIEKNADAQWWIPTENQWYKAAYYDPTKPGKNPYWNYPTRSDELPIQEAYPGGTNSANYNSVMKDGLKITPVGAYTQSVSHYGTFDQAGLLWEWNDAAYEDHDGVAMTRGMRGGSWSLGVINVSKFGPRDYEPNYNDDDTGFRIATTPKRG
jgi:formylglycine-generating enzyme required for sulfatase activity